MHWAPRLPWRQMKLVLTVIGVCGIVQQVLTAAFSPLYTSADEGLVILDNSNFTSHLSHKNNAFFVEFYNTWCGHCVKFAPTFKDFARDVRHWSPVVQQAVVDCAEDRNHHICREYEIYMYPSLRLFPANYTPMRDYSEAKPEGFESQANKTGIPYDGGIDGSQTLRTHLIDMIKDLKHVPSQWPQLNASSAVTKRDFIRFLPSATHIPNVVIIEPNESYIGTELILDFSINNNEVHVTRISESSKELIHDLLGSGSKSLPLLIEFSRSENSVHVLCCDNATTDNDKDLRKTFYGIIRDKYLSHADAGPLKRPDVKVSQVPHGHDGQIRRPDSGQPHENAVQQLSPVHMDDLFNALRYSIYNQMTSHQKLNSTDIEAMQSFLRVVERYFPFDPQHDKSKAAIFVKLVSKWAATKRQSLSTDDLIKEMNQFEDDYSLPDMRPYSSCQGSSSRFRGYPCSLWLLFHTLTVNEYLRHQSDELSARHDVLPAMRKFILSFFGCTDCARHFAVESDGLEDQLTKSQSSVLWLWKTHNRVNKRLAGDASQDPQHPKIQFPSKSACPHCHLANGSFDEEQVLKFLVQQYQPQSMIQSKRTGDVTHRTSHSTKSHDAPHGEQQRQQKYGTQSAGPDGEPVRFVSSYYSLLNRTDITIFVILYLLSVTLLIGLFLFFRARGKRKKVSHHYQISNPNLRYMA